MSAPRRRTQQDDTWCTVRLHRKDEPLPEQCKHAESKGRYVVKIGDEWYCFDPPTKLQALSWVNNKPERRRRIHWQCFTCDQIMPLGSYEDN